ncbi:hypothetical protein [Brevibacillus laterosporus]|uniref:hypothetical protein n=1 Tax=Brevibacillus laterosporus TaxID=1465 RepID=UPI000E6D513F|nr:hypothetical protein [Brevibacillus laterosporus]AYB37610.1 hypothetical protein D5F52_04555 [Brevibacillus laterosporus]
MLYHELNEQLKAGDIVYICDYRFNNIDQQPIRHIIPQRVMVFSNSDLPKGKKVYYSEHHFRPLNKKDKPLSRIIAPYDNTGYRSYKGVSLNIFFTKEECIKHYQQQCKQNIKEYEKAKIDKLNYYENKINEIKEEMSGLQLE